MAAEAVKPWWRETIETIIDNPDVYRSSILDTERLNDTDIGSWRSGFSCEILERFL